MTETDQPASQFEEPLLAQILGGMLSALESSTSFDSQCLDRLRQLIDEGEVTTPDRVIEALRDPER